MGDLKVNISVLNNLDLLQIEKLSPENRAQLFKGTDLHYDEKTGQIKEIQEGGIEKPYTLAAATDQIAVYQSFDGNKDGIVELSEVKTVLEARHENADPEQYLKNIELGLKNRFAPLANNYRAVFNGKTRLQIFVKTLRDYNIGRFKADTLAAEGSVEHTGSLAKAGLNIFGSLYGIYRAIHSLTDLGSDPVGPGYKVGQTKIAVDSNFYFDKTAGKRARSDFDAREAGLTTFEKIIREGFEKGEKWALEGDLKVALDQLDAPTRQQFETQLAARKLADIYSIKDDQERANKKLEFADNEKTKFIGYGGGNTSDRNIWNWFGQHNNTYFAKTIYGELAKKSVAKDSRFEEKIHEEAFEKLMATYGNGGSLANVVGATLQRPLSGFGLFFKPIDYEPWSEEEKMSGVSNVVMAGLGFFTGLKAVSATRDVWAFSPVSKGTAGFGEVWNLWREGATWRNLGLSFSFGGKAREAAARIATEKTELTFLGRAIGGIQDRVYGGLEKVSFGKKATQTADAAQTAATTSTQAAGALGKEGVSTLGRTIFVDGTFAVAGSGLFVKWTDPSVLAKNPYASDVHYDSSALVSDEPTADAEKK